MFVYLFIALHVNVFFKCVCASCFFILTRTIVARRERKDGKILHYKSGGEFWRWFPVFFFSPSFFLSCTKSSCSSSSGSSSSSSGAAAVHI